MTARVQRIPQLQGVSQRNHIFITPAARRYLHSKNPPARRNVSTAPIPPIFSNPASSTAAPSRPSTLARLPTSTVLRSYLITGLSSSPIILTAGCIAMRRMLDSKSAILSIEKNPILSKFLKSTFYAQFCAGETPEEVRANTALAKSSLGYDGIILEFALEVLEGEVPTEAETAKEIETWRTGMLASVDMASPGDFIGFKWSGLGRQALHLLQAQQEPSPAMWSAMTQACDAAAAKGVCLLPGAEEEATNPGLEKWNLALQKQYNTQERGFAVVYTTYQCYLKNIGQRLAQHLEKAATDGYIAGVKLVRGAYLASEPRHLTWETKEGTDANYDNLAEGVLTRSWTPALQAPSNDPAAPFPNVNIVIATHNLISVQKAKAIRGTQLLSAPPESLPRLAYAQLQGMADEISQELVQDPERKLDVQSKVVKLFAFGTVTECMNFLIRRAIENKEAALRTVDTRKAMGSELWRRAKAFFGLA